MDIRVGSTFGSMSTNLRTQLEGLADARIKSNFISGNASAHLQPPTGIAKRCASFSPEAVLPTAHRWTLPSDLFKTYVPHFRGLLS